MRIVVLVKPVPDPASGGERLGPDGRLDRSAAPVVINGNDEYALEAALKLVEAHGGEVVLLAMAPSGGMEAIRKGLAMGATSGILVTDEALAGADAPTTIRVVAAALKDVEADLVLAGVDTSDGQMGVVPAGVAALLGRPYVSWAAAIEPNPDAGTVRVKRAGATGFDVLEAALPAVISGTQALGAPRYPSLKGIMAARSKEVATKTLADLGVEAPGGGWTTTVVDSAPPPPRAATQVVRGTADEGAAAIVELLAARRLI